MNDKSLVNNLESQSPEQNKVPLNEMPHNIYGMTVQNHTVNQDIKHNMAQMMVNQQPNVNS